MKITEAGFRYNFPIFTQADIISLGDNNEFRFWMYSNAIKQWEAVSLVDLNHEIGEFNRFNSFHILISKVKIRERSNLVFITDELRYLRFNDLTVIEDL